MYWGRDGERGGGRAVGAEAWPLRLRGSVWQMQEPTAGTCLHIQRMTRGQSGWSRANWSKAEGDEVRGIGRPFRPWRGSSVMS